MSYSANPNINQTQSSRGGRWGLLVFFFCSLLFALGGWAPVLTDVSGFQARFTGVQTTAQVSATGDCGDDDGNGNYFTYTFVDIHERVQHITNDSDCSSGIVSDGDRVTVWYNPNDPSQMLTQNDLNFDLVFIIGFSIPLLICLVLCVVLPIRGLMKRRRQEFASINSGNWQ